MSKLNNLIAIAQPIPETQAETINGGRSLADLGRQVSGSYGAHGSNQDWAALARAQKAAKLRAQRANQR